MSFALAMSWHGGEEEMQRLMKVPPGLDNPTAPGLTLQASTMFQKAPLLAIGTLDAQGRPWTSLWGGSYGFVRPLGASLVGLRTPVDTKQDPVVEALFRDAGRDRAQGDVPGEAQREGQAQAQAQPKMVSGLTLDLETRKRVKIYGRMAAGGLAQDSDQEDDDQFETQLVIRIDQSLGNCPKYINSKHLSPAPTKGELISDSALLSETATNIITNSDVFFLSSAHSDEDMDTNLRGGPRGFVRTQISLEGQTQIIWPEYSGNRLYQTLGNLRRSPRAGLVFADFESGDVLYATGTTEILIGGDAASLMPRTNLAVRLTVSAARFVRSGLPFRGTAGEQSPYTPKVRPLASEASQFAKATQDAHASPLTATLVERTQITPDVYRLRFQLDRPAAWTVGQWVALDLSDELDEGYSHMRNDDPTSLNDDWIRTFTISSPPPPVGDSTDALEVTLRAVGPVTRFLVRQNPRAGFEVPVRGIGGDFDVTRQRAGGGDDDSEHGGELAFVAGGVGVTPLLAALPQLPPATKVTLLWSVRRGDVPLVLDTLRRHSSLASSQSTTVFVTGGPSTGNDTDNDTELAALKAAGARVECHRRLAARDLDGVSQARTWHVCAGRALRETVTDWLQARGREVVFEDFNF